MINRILLLVTFLSVGLFSSVHAQCDEITTMDILCTSGSADFIVGAGCPGGGTSYTWSVNQIMSGPNPSISGSSEMATISDLGTVTGDFAVQVFVDRTGMGLDTTIIDTFSVLGGVGFSLTTVPAACDGSATGSINLASMIGPPPFLVSWSGEATGMMPGVTGPSFSIMGLENGDYDVTVEASNMCSFTAPTITVMNGPGVNYSASTMAASCDGVEDGQINLTAMMGAMPFFVEWDGEEMGDMTGVTGPSFDILTLAGGTYGVTVTDAGGCSSTMSGISVGEGAGVSFASATTDTSCPGEDDGEINLTSIVGASTFTIEWDGEESGSTSGVAGPSHNIVDLSAGTYNVTITDLNGCSDIETGISLSDSPFPIITNSNSPESLCSGSSTTAINLTSSPSADTYTWTISNTNISEAIASGSGSTIPSEVLTLVSGNGSGSIVYTVTPFIGTCAGPPVDFLKDVDAVPEFGSPNVVTNCTGETIDNVVVNGLIDGGVLLQYNIDGGSWGTNPLFPGVSSGSHIFGVRSAANTDCEIFATETIECDCASVNGNTISADQEFCFGIDAAALVGSTPTTTPGGVTFTYQWESKPSAGGSFAAIGGANSKDYDPGILSESTDFRRLVAVVDCDGEPSNEITITVNPLPAEPTAGMAMANCENETNVAISATPGAGEGIFWYAAATGGSPLNGSASNTYVNPASAPNTYFFFAEAVNSTTACSSPTRAIVQHTINATPDSPTSGGNQFVCEGESNPNLMATPGAGEAVDWFTSSSGGSPIASGPSFQPSDSAPGTYSYFAEARNTSSLCESSTRTEITLTIQSAPQPAGIGSNEENCFGEPNESLNVTVGAMEVADWFLGQTGGSSIFTGLNFVSSETVPNTYTYWIEARNTSTGCKSLNRVSMTLTINPLPSSATPGPNETICEGDATPTLTASAPAGASVNWYTMASGGTAIATGTTFVPTQTSPGNYSFWVESENNTTNCQSAIRLEIVFTINPLPNAPSAGPDVAACEGTPNPAVTASVPSGQTVLWFDVMTGGTSIATGNSFVSSETLPGVYTYYAESQIGSTSCVSNSRTPVILTINALPDSPMSGGDVNTCSGQSNPVMSVTIGAGESASWYEVSTGGSPIQNGVTFTSPETAVGTYIYYVETTSSAGCFSATRTAVSTTIDATPNLIDIDETCDGGSLDFITVEADILVGELEYRVDNGAWQDSEIFPGLSLALHTFDIREKISLCSVSADFTPVCGCPGVSNNSIAANQAICLNETPDQLVGGDASTEDGAPFTYLWQEREAGSTIWNDAVTTRDYAPGSLSISTEYRRAVQVNACNDEFSNLVNVIVNPEPSVSNSTTTDVSCSGNITNGFILQSSPVGASFSWTSSSNNVTGNTASGTGNIIPEVLTLVDNDSPGSVTYTVVPTSVDGCVGAAQNFVVTINSLPEFTLFSSTGQTICPGEMATLEPQGLPAGSYNYLWTLPNGDNAFSDIIEVSVSSAAQTTYTLQVTDGNGCLFARSFTYTLSAFAPNLVTDDSDNSICEEDEISLTATGGSTYMWTGDGTPTNDLTNFFTITPPVGANPYSVVITNGAGCSATFDQTVVVNPKPEPVILANQTEYCEDDLVSLNTEIPYDGGYDWGNGNTGPTLAFLANPLQTNFNVEVTDINACQNTDDIDLIIHNKPEAVICNFTAGGVCQIKSTQSGLLLTFTADDVEIDPDCEGNISYTWNFRQDGTLIRTETVGENTLDITFTAEEEGINSVELIITDNCTCSSDVIASSDFEVISNEKCFVNVASESKVCLGSEYELEALPNTGAGTFNDPRYGYFVIEGLKIIDVSLTVPGTGEVINSDIVVDVEAMPASGKNFIIRDIEQVFESGDGLKFNDVIEIEYLSEGDYDIKYVYDFDVCGDEQNVNVSAFDIPRISSLDFDLEACAGEEEVDFVFTVTESDFEYELKYDKGGPELTAVLVNETTILPISLPGQTDVLITLGILTDDESGCENEEYIGQEFLIDVLDPVTATYTSECNSENDSIFYTLEIEGGTGSYAVGNEMLAGNTYTSIGFVPEQPQVFLIEDTECDEENITPIANVIGSCEFCVDLQDFTEKITAPNSGRADICDNQSEIFEFDFSSSSITDTNGDGAIDFKDTLLSNQTILYVIRTLNNNIYDEADVLVNYRPLNAQFTDISSFELVFTDALDSVLVLGEQYWLTAFVVPSTDAFAAPIIGCAGTTPVSLQFYASPTAVIDISLEDDLAICKQEIDYQLSSMTNADVNVWTSDDPDNVNFEIDLINNRVLAEFSENVDGQVKIYLNQENQFTPSGAAVSCFDSDSITLTVIPDQIAPLEDSIIWFPGDFLAYTDTSMCYEWGYLDANLNETNLVNETTRFYIYDEAGSFTEKTFFVDVYDCDDLNRDCVTRVYYNASGPPVLQFKPDAEYDVRLYPNPNVGEFLLKLDGEQGGIFQMRMYNATGNLVSESQFLKEYTEHEEVYNFTHLPNGLYIIQVIDKGGLTNTIKMVKN